MQLAGDHPRLALLRTRLLLALDERGAAYLAVADAYGRFIGPPRPASGPAPAHWAPDLTLCPGEVLQQAQRTSLRWHTGGGTERTRRASRR